MAVEAKVDRRILRTRESIHTAFIELLSKKEFDKITVNDIADQANVNRTTIYLHYLDKYDLLDQCIEDYLNQMTLSCSDRRLIHEEFNVMCPVQALNSLFVYLSENHQFFYAMLCSKQISQFRERMSEITSNVIREKLEMDGINEGMDMTLVTQYTVSAFVGTVEWWILNRMPLSSQAMAEQMWRLFERQNIS